MPKPSPPAEPAEDLLDQAARLADQGHLDAALAACEDSLRRQGPSARLFYLMGLVRDAGGQVDAAMTAYRKALYLDPQHAAALAQVVLLLEKQGDRAGAEVARRRAALAQKAGNP